MFDWWSKAVIGKVEVDERSAYEDAGGVDLLVERLLAIDEEHVHAFAREQASTLESGQPRADNRDVITRSHKTSPSSLHRKAGRLSRARGIAVKYFIGQRSLLFMRPVFLWAFRVKLFCWR